jgi:hypothetical protein
MAKKGPNSKAEAANAKKAAAKAEKDKQKSAAAEAAESSKWAQGAKKGNNKKEQEEEKKVGGDSLLCVMNQHVLFYRLLPLQEKPKLPDSWYQRKRSFAHSFIHVIFFRLKKKRNSKRSLL